uniref:magnesium/cobalt transporter CorA n=1 Tax=Flavobacterium sp. TaxID=239 RepID=UPI00404A6850
MTKHKSKKKSKFGLAPGTAVFTGVQKMDSIEIFVTQYNEDSCHELKCNSIQELKQMLSNTNDKIWVNIAGLHDEESIIEICNHLEIHKLTIEDLVSIGQRPKIEEFEDYLFMVVKMFQQDLVNKDVDIEQISFILKDKLLLTFQEKTGDVFQSIRARLHDPKSMIRKRGTDYLLYALLDSVVDHYFLIIENLSTDLEDLEEILLKNPSEDGLNALHHIRRNILSLRRSAYPLREVVSKFEKIESSKITVDTKLFIRDLYDHTIQVIETIEVFRDIASGLLDLYMNSVANKMNEIMKLLTIIATIFIPLTFLAGIYGMNFENMPELKTHNGYFIFLGAMVVIFLAMLIYFKRKKWL